MEDPTLINPASPEPPQSTSALPEPTVDSVPRHATKPEQTAEASFVPESEPITESDQVCEPLHLC